jgi:hypothetical protein
MSYRPDFAPSAAAVIRAVHPRLGWRIFDAIDRLCADPSSLSIPFYSAPVGRYQMYETTIEDRGEKWLLKVFFSYQPDELTLNIDDLLLSPLDPLEFR